MKYALLMATAFFLLAVTSPAFAYQLKKDDNSQCVADGSTCNVFCDNGDKAGAMNWNLTVWTDGLKSDPDKDGEARKIVAAYGTACQ